MGSGQRRKPPPSLLVIHCCLSSVAERVRNAATESKQDGSGQHRGKRATPPDGVWRGLQEKATNRRAERQGDAEGQTVERHVAAEQMGWRHVRDQWPENIGVYAFADREDDRNAGEETGRSELRVDERRRQDREQADRKNRDRKSTRLNSSHVSISYAVFCL